MHWLLLITTKQLQTHGATAKGAPARPAGPGDEAKSVARPQAGPPPRSALGPQVHSHAEMRPRQPCSPAASSTCRAEIAGRQGESRLRVRPHSQRNVTVTETSGREVCPLRSAHIMTAAELLSVVWWMGSGGRGGGSQRRLEPPDRLRVGTCASVIFYSCG